MESSTAIATALLPVLGYERAAGVAHEARAQGKSIRQVVLDHDLMSEKTFDTLITPEAVMRLGMPEGTINGQQG